MGAWAALALCVAQPAVWAQDAAPAETLVAQAQAQAQGEPAMRVHVQTSTLPRLEAQDSGFQAPRVDVSVFPARPAHYGLGAVLGMSGFAARQGQGPIGMQPQRPSFDLGLRWSQRLNSQQVDITAWRRMNTDDDAYTLVQSREPVYGARFEMSLAAAAKRSSSYFGFDRGFIGLQLQSGARISLKRKDGRPMIYYRTAF
ncbi:MAG TPA: hypothetical protein VFM98_05670 [Ramlibacter sp.]|uniref:hypothetical protein n=1 Tax=Ramlibacter sp. TaxID=1917967 RepID=UPI002D80249B|nr:hypothetical protein [Ramlibacter sp.]HET8745070.1 hypothetical protein [Ramlibacter sp.]